ncbi:cytochrome c biogenesis CcdA family protein [Blastococcus mobilis]|uniref:Cytochrome c biogenesis protein CcdA n=1 Tax=Blastococcus mobilis TaxID=1938746 RepID=A0A239A963_9ACTN|nr:cytochrome c biogenesis protein CcdA [Blastococcus mobilis]SNR92100.1 Cytochrome c biogenesis protein CcdA [Blastococcus mobilis]
MDPALFAMAFVAGAVAAFNPCGFALVPAYLGLLVNGPGTVKKEAAWRAIRFTTGMAAGFVAVFGLVGLLVAPLAASLHRHLPVLTVVVGVVLLLLGAWLLAGHRLALPGSAGRGRPPTESWGSQVGFGVSFALASLSCTLAPFLAVTAGSLRAGGPLAVAVVFLVYALGMGIVVLALSLAVALTRRSLVRRMRRVGALMSRGSGALLIAAGGYVAWYGWFELRVLSGRATDDPVVAAAVTVQGALARWVAGLGAGGLAGLGLVTAVSLTVLLRRQYRRTRELQP